MNEDRPLQLSLPPPIDGVLMVPFRGPSSREDIKLFKEAIDSQLSVGAEIKRVIFDLSEIHPYLNAAGRILDLACEYHEIRHFPVEVRVPARTYNLLREIEPHNMPKATGKKPVEVRGVTVVVLRKTLKPTPGEMERYFATSPADVDEPVTILLCECRVTHLDDTSVTVSLDTKDGEVIAEFDRIQFPKGLLVPGMMFEYRVTVTHPGKTNISIDAIPPQQATDEELVEETAAIRREIPGLEKLDV